jgi:hypothetical protein
MSTTTRADHLTWCKRRALEYLPGDAPGALASMISDLSKSDDTKDHPALGLTMMLMMAGLLSTPDEVRKHIEGL